jgi:putative phosphoribosyl transferase
MNGMFRDRSEAGRLLAPKLREFANHDDAIVLALPRGGVPVGFEVARKLRVPWDVLVVRKLGVPGQEELAMGAIASGGIEVLDTSIVSALGLRAIDIAAVVRREREELERRESLYRGKRAECDLKGKIVILIDDGLATGSTMRAAVHAVRSKGPRAIVVAAPVASVQAVDALRREATAVVTVITTAHLFAIGNYYRDFHQVEDAEVQALLAKSGPNAGKHESAAA